MIRFALMSATALALATGGAPGLAFADVSQGVISSFRGQLVVSKDELPEGKGDKETVAKIKAVQLHEIVGGTGEEVTHWHFHYTAFLAKSGSGSLRLEFITDDKNKKLQADKQLEGVDPKSNVISGDIAIDEDEGLIKGKTYSVQVVSGSTVVAKSTVTFK